MHFWAEFALHLHYFDQQVAPACVFLFNHFETANHFAIEHFIAFLNALFLQSATIRSHH